MTAAGAKEEDGGFAGLLLELGDEAEAVRAAFRQRTVNLRKGLSAGVCGGW